MRQPNLDEVFLALTGRPGRPQSAQWPQAPPERKPKGKYQMTAISRRRPTAGHGRRTGLARSTVTVTRRALLRYVAHAAADRARHGPDVAVLPDLPLHVRRRDPHRRDVLRRLSRAGLHRHRRAVLGDRDRDRDGRGPRARVRRPAALAADPAQLGADRPRRRRTPRSSPGARRSRRRSRSRWASRSTARRSTGSRRSGSWSCSGSRSNGCSSRWACSPATRRRRRGWG